jgi:hypothetical protein
MTKKRSHHSYELDDLANRLASRPTPQDIESAQIALRWCARVMDSADRVVREESAILSRARRVRPVVEIRNEWKEAVIDALAAWPGMDFAQAINGAIAFNDTGEFVERLSDAAENGVSIAMDFDTSMRDGLFEDGQLFAVYERADIEALIARLQRCLA